MQQLAKLLKQMQIPLALLSGMGLTALVAYVVLVVRPVIEIPNIFSSNEAQASSSTSSAVDARPLEVEVVKPEREVANPYTEITVITNKLVSFGEKEFLSSELAGSEDGKNYYIVRVSDIRQVGRQFTLEVQDEVGNTFSQKIEIESRPVRLPAGLSAIEGWEGSSYILDANKFDVNVSKLRRLREDYEPLDLVDLNKKHGIYTLNSARLREGAAAALVEMLGALRRETGVTDVTVVSGYRSFETQLATYAGWVSSVGQQRADEISARPGHSDHQLGTVFDLSTVSAGYKLGEEFTGSAAGKWLAENASQFGFVQYSNPDYAPEPWQYKYIGVQTGTGNE